MAVGPLCKPSAESETEEMEFTQAQLLESHRLMEEMPRIEAGLKNFLSMRMAEAMTPAPENTSAAAMSGSQAAAALQGCARVLLRTLNAIDLPTSTEWSQLHPQGEKEPGFDFLNRIGAYKVVQALWERCRSQGQKPAKLLGRSALRFALPEVIDKILLDAHASAQAAGVPEEQLRDFLDGFAETLDDRSGDAESMDNNAELVWAADMNAALAARQRARKAEAAERVQRAASADTFVGDLHAALSGQRGSSSVQVEEVED